MALIVRKGTHAPGLFTSGGKTAVRAIWPPTSLRARGELRLLLQLLTLLTNPLAIILMVASVISAALGEVINASIIITMVLLSVALNFIQTTAASPPHVRQGYALPVVFFFNSGLGPRLDRKSTRLNSSHVSESRMPSSA